MKKIILIIIISFSVINLWANKQNNDNKQIAGIDYYVLKIGDQSFSKKSYNLYEATIVKDNLKHIYDMTIEPGNSSDGVSLKLTDMDNWQDVPLVKNGSQWNLENPMQYALGTYKYKLQYYKNGELLQSDELDVVVQGENKVTVNDIINNVTLASDNSAFANFYSTDKNVTATDQLCLMGNYNNVNSNDVKIQAVTTDDRMKLAFGDSENYSENPVTTVHLDGCNEQKKVSILKVKDVASGEVVAQIPVYLRLNNPINRILINDQVIIPINREVTYTIALKKELENYNVTIVACVPQAGYKIVFDTGKKELPKSDYISMAANFSDSKDNLLNVSKTFYVHDENTNQMIPYTVHIVHKWQDSDNLS